MQSPKQWATRLRGGSGGGGGGAVSSVSGKTGAVTLDKTDVGLTNVDNTADLSKPVSTATQTALNAKAPLASPAFTGTPTGITKAHVGLGSVDNTSDASKPVSSAAQSALDLKAPLANPAFTGTPTGITKSHVGLGNVDNTSNATERAAVATLTNKTLTAPVINAPTGVVKADVGLGNVDNTSDTAKPVSNAQQNALDLKAPLASPTFTGTVTGISKSMVGLGSVDNTADSAKPVSTAQQTALNLKANLASPTFTGTVSGISAAMVGLGNVDNTSDSAKPISTATQTALNDKAPIASPAFTGAATGNGTVPTAGTAGQVLTKNSNSNYDLTWATPSGGGGGAAPLVPLATRSGYWYNNKTGSAIAPSGATMFANNIYYIPVFIPRSTSISTLSMAVYATSASTIRMGLFTPNANGEPGTCVSMSAATASAASAAVKTFALPSTYVASAGWYFIAMGTDGTSATITVVSPAGTIALGVDNAANAAAPNLTATSFYLSNTGGGSAFTSNPTVSPTDYTSPVVAYRVA